MPDHLDGDPDVPREERRQHERSRLIVDVFFDGQEATGVANTRDIGAGGLYLNTQAEIPDGAELMLRISFGRRHIVARAQVVYSNPGRGLGLRFQNLSEDDRDFIQGFSAT